MFWLFGGHTSEPLCFVAIRLAVSINRLFLWVDRNLWLVIMIMKAISVSLASGYFFLLWLTLPEVTNFVLNCHYPSLRWFSFIFQSLTILATIPAAILIFSLVLLLLYLMTRCCDRKSKKQRTFGCQKCTLIFVTILCCGAIGGGTCRMESRATSSGRHSNAWIFNFLIPFFSLSPFMTSPCR